MVIAVKSLSIAARITQLRKSIKFCEIHEITRNFVDLSNKLPAIVSSNMN